MLKLWQKKEKDYIDAISDKGRIRDSNEDSVIAVEHKDIKSIKLLAVADGVGGGSFGKLASSKCINDIENWFQNKDMNDFQTMQSLKKEFILLLQDLNDEIFNFTKDPKDYSGTTLTCAIIGQNETFIGSIGDSRCYLLKGDDMEQVTNDDSYVWQWYQSGLITKEEARISIYNRVITKAIGLSSEEIQPEILIKENSSYDKLLLFTDGVTDCLSDLKIKLISSRKKYKKILNHIIYQAVNIKQSDFSLGSDFLIPKPGKDNTSGAIYIKEI